MVDITKYTKKVHNIIGLCFEVHKEIGGGLLEPIYQECLEREFMMANVPFVREQELRLTYKGRLLEKTYFADFVCYDDIVVELKSVSELNTNHRAQLFNYLRMIRKPYGILINFGLDSIQFEKYGYDQDANRTWLISRYDAKSNNLSDSYSSLDEESLF